MAASISYDKALRAVIAISGPQVTRDSMSDSIRRITTELAANDCSRLLVEMSTSQITVPVENTTIILDRLLNAVHGHLTVAMVFNSEQSAYADHVAAYLSAGMVNVESFASLDSARNWVMNDSAISRRA